MIDILRLPYSIIQMFPTLFSTVKWRLLWEDSGNSRNELSAGDAAWKLRGQVRPWCLFHRWMRSWERWRNLSELLEIISGRALSKGPQVNKGSGETCDRLFPGLEIESSGLCSGLDCSSVYPGVALWLMVRGARTDTWLQRFCLQSIKRDPEIRWRLKCKDLLGTGLRTREEKGVKDRNQVLPFWNSQPQVIPWNQWFSTKGNVPVPSTLTAQSHIFMQEAYGSVW